MGSGLVDIRFDKRKLRAVQRQLRGIPGAMPKVMSRAINKTTMGARTQIKRRIKGEVNMKVGAIGKGIALTRATVSRWLATLDLFSKRIPLVQFATRQTKKGVGYKIDPQKPRQSIESAFIQTMKSGHRAVMKRRAGGRLPIDERFGPSIGAVFEDAGTIAKDVVIESSKKLGANVDVQIGLILRRKAG